MPASTSVHPRDVAVIGSGFAGLSAAAYLAKNGCNVDVYEKNDQIGGRARQLHAGGGYVFDMGPSWYWMPDVYERFFNDFGFKCSDFYDLHLLDPSYSIIYPGHQVLDIPSGVKEIFELFESIEKGSAGRLQQFLKEAEYKYRLGINKLVYKPGLSLGEFADASLIKGILKLQVFTSFSSHVRKFFKDPKLIAMMEFPVLFLGAMPEDTPAMYSLMNYAALNMGTWYPMGGFGKVAGAMKTVAERQGAKFFTAEAATGFSIRNGLIKEVRTKKRTKAYDGVIMAADYHHAEEQLLGPDYRNYSEHYWDKRVMAPSCLLFYLGVKRKVPGLKHHNLFFDEDLAGHAYQIYKNPQWPSKPLFYVCCASKTDPSVAPGGHENLFILMPLATNLDDGEAVRQQYFNVMMDRLESFAGMDIRHWLDYKKSYCVADFKEDYNAYKGNAYGLANTLSQTAILKPSLRNRKVHNLFYAGQLTVPGPGVPPAIISGNLAADQLLKHLNRNR